MLCQLLCTGLKRLTASVSFLRILLKEATCHAVREPELTTLRGEREREIERERDTGQSPAVSAIPADMQGCQ